MIRHEKWFMALQTNEFVNIMEYNCIQVADKMKKSKEFT